MISVLVLATIAIFAVAYVTYGRFIARQMNLGDTYQTPAHEINDGIDYVPARAPLLLGKYFSATAAAGPTVGPILAAGYVIGGGPTEVFCKTLASGSGSV